MVHDHILQRGAHFRETGARLRSLSNAKIWVFNTYLNLPAARILRVAHAECIDVRGLASFEDASNWRVWWPRDAGRSVSSLKRTHRLETQQK
jgi:hypothetical protein